MNTTDFLLYATAAVFPLFLVIEALRKTRRQPSLPAWRFVGIGFFIVFALISFYLPLLLPPEWFAASLLPGAEIGIAGGTIVGYLATTLVGYAWHRAAHRVPLLWRAFHQMHHSPRRPDVSSAVIFHPSEMVIYTLISLVVTTVLLGLDPVAASIVGLVSTFNAVLQHTDMRTPRWLSLLMQRPESHSIHHASGVHGWNYSDFPLWDRMFGTFREGQDFQPRAGFDEQASARWLSMAAMRDVHEPDFEQPGRVSVGGA